LVGNTIIGPVKLIGHSSDPVYFAYNYLEAEYVEFGPYVLAERNVMVLGANPSSSGTGPSFALICREWARNTQILYNTIVGPPGRRLFLNGGPLLGCRVIGNVFWRPEYGGGDPLLTDPDMSEPRYVFADNVLSDPTFSMLGIDGNVSIDPLFVDPYGGDFRLLPGSPLIDRGTEGTADPDGTPPDLGGMAFDHDNPHFLRGDVSGDGKVRLEDAVLLLGYLFVGAEVACLRAGDFSDDERVDLSDALSLLQFLFAGSVPPAAPYPEVAHDPTPDSLPCGLRAEQ
jgi:hypothetical protein